MSSHPPSTPAASEPAASALEPVASRRSFAITSTLAGAAFAAFPLLRPWGDKTGDPIAMARAFADPLWVAAHASGMLGWVLLASSAVLAVSAAHRTSSAVSRRTALPTMSAWLIGLGVAGILPYYGSEAFALHSLGRTVLASGDTELIGMESLIRGEPVAMTLFGLGLLFAAIGAVLLTVARWRGRSSQGPGSGWQAVPVAVLVCLYLPQFFAPDPVRIIHGLLLGIACALWATTALPRHP